MIPLPIKISLGDNMPKSLICVYEGHTDCAFTEYLNSDTPDILGYSTYQSLSKLIKERGYGIMYSEEKEFYKEVAEKYDAVNCACECHAV